MGDDPTSPPELKAKPALIANWMQLHGWMAAQPEGK
jgi:hypothetical protein